MKILVVEDEKKVARFIQQALEEEHHTVDTASDGEEGETKALTSSYDLIVLDIMLPRQDGLSILRHIRERKLSVPVLLLTAKSTVEDRVEGLDAGADDYLPKPFAVAELLARVRSLLRRTSTVKATILRAADLQLDTVTHKAKRGDSPIELTSKEYTLLEFFLRNKNKVLGRTLIAEHIWDYHFDTGTNIIEVYVNHLRAKVDDDFSLKLIHTVRGVGYVLRDE